MCHDFECVPQNSSLRDAAEQMRELDIGMLPVEKDGEIVGTLTDRDITIRATAEGSDPNRTQVSDIMSHEIYTCVENDDLNTAAHLMEEYRVRRLMVQNERGDFVGMLSLADLARHSETEQLCAEILEEVSQAVAAH